jgi:hypothetical protein
LVRFHLTRTQAVRPDAAHPGFALDGLHQGRTEKFGLGAIFPHPLVGSGGVCPAVYAVFTGGLSERLRPLWKQLSAAPTALPCDFRLGAKLMQRLAKPSDYVRQDVLGQSTYVLPWEPRLCPGNPADDPELGAQLYNEFACNAAQGVTPRSPAEQLADIIGWVIATPGEAACGLAADLAATYQGKHQFRLEDLQHWDEETKPHRAHLIFHNQELRALSARTIMALRFRAETVQIPD